MVLKMHIGSKHRAFGHALVAGVDRAPLKVTVKMSKKKIAKRTRVKRHSATQRVASVAGRATRGRPRNAWPATQRVAGHATRGLRGHLETLVIYAYKQY